MKSPSFRYLWIGQTLANTGDIFYIAGLIAVLYQLTGSAMILAAVPLCITIAKMISGLLAPLLLDKFRLESLLFYSQGGKTLLLLVLAAESRSMLFVLFTLVFCISFLDGFAGPARNAMLPSLVEREELMKANSFVATLDQAVQLGGWALGGVLGAAVGGMPLLWITILLFFTSTALMRAVRIKKSPQEAVPASKWESVKEGWQVIWKVPALRTIHILLILETATGAVWIAALLYIYVKEQLQMGEEWWGYINASFFLGLIAGGLISFRCANFLERHLRFLIPAGGFGIALSTLWFGLTVSPAAALTASALFGIMEQVKTVCMTTALQQSAALHQMPKVYSAQGTLIALVFGMCSAITGFAADRAPIGFVYAGAAAILGLSALYSAAKRRQFA
ncbi:MFS transporter [Metabacillus sp. GX 13764]|uniref:MFS transporter n=1 Tax=Metabacillus kandeliae TaxID=2900151 RepID=UPI001E3A461C|nr:MFS transporter [Metabacillus kandeliae]MCD7036026.1 MFS transporter [Metabacillus kandeliae]